MIYLVIRVETNGNRVEVSSFNNEEQAEAFRDAVANSPCCPDFVDHYEIITE